MTSEVDPITPISNYILEKFYPGKTELTLDPDQSLSRQGAIQSIDWVELVLFIEKTFQIRVRPQDMREANFGSLNAISRYVRGKLGQTG